VDRTAKQRRGVFLVHWNKDGGHDRARELRRTGHAVSFESPVRPETFRVLRTRPPAAVVIDLSRLPSHGRDVALALRGFKATRHVPLVFVDGDPVKVAHITTMLPDAVYTSWKTIRSALRLAIAHPPEQPVVPASALAGYSGTPLPRKLGIKPKSHVVIIGSPGGFRSLLGSLPSGVRFSPRNTGYRDLTIWFVKTLDALERRIVSVAGRAAGKPLWIAWPKKTSLLAADLTQAHVRRTGLNAGWVDYKICSIDDTWSALLFRRRAEE